MEKTKGELLAEQLCYKPKNGYDVLEKRDLQEAEDLCVEYKSFLDKGKTEREFAAYVRRYAEKRGFKPLVPGEELKPGDKVYQMQCGKAIILAVVGNAPAEEGVSIVAAHIDSPRLDLKPRPLYEDSDLAYFKTHYYGGIRKYQWPCMPLALHGVISKRDGSTVTVNIGEAEDDPVFCVTDLLPHLAVEQSKEPLSKAIKGENLNALIGSCPFKDDKVSEKVKLNILNLLYERYEITEADLLSAELELVPAFKARDVGLDRSMVGAYGHDDRVCAYTALRALVDLGTPQRTALCVLVDKEETGSDGITGMKSKFIEFFLENLAVSLRSDYRVMMTNSVCISADVNAAYDPSYPEPFDKRNSVVLNNGIAVTKYVGSGGKGGTSDANSEYFGRIRGVLDQAGVVWQTGEMGKVDAGGGGTVAKFIANLNVETIDAGVPVLSMHSPFEVVSKLDVYSAYRAFLAFQQSQI